jgi:serine/threonine protein kinase
VYKGGIMKIGDFGISKKSLEYSNTMGDGGKSMTDQFIGTLFILFLLIVFIFYFLLLKNIYHKIFIKFYFIFFSDYMAPEIFNSKEFYFNFNYINYNKKNIIIE